MEDNSLCCTSGVTTKIWRSEQIAFYTFIDFNVFKFTVKHIASICVQMLDITYLNLRRGRNSTHIKCLNKYGHFSNHLAFMNTSVHECSRIR